jgi:hypothetical protein
MVNRVINALKSAAPVGLGAAVILTFIAVVRWQEFAADPVASVTAFVGLFLIVFVTYFILAFAGYRVRPDGFVSAPRPVAWALVAVTATVLVVIIVILAFRAK